MAKIIYQGAAEKAALLCLQGVITILDWIFEGIINWVASIMSSVMDSVSGIFLSALGTDMSTMEEYFPFVTRAFEIMQYTAWALLFIITIWQLFRAFGGPITESENPWQLLAHSIIFAVMIGFARPIFSLALDIARAPYSALMDASMNPGDFTFAGIENVISSSLNLLVAAVSIVGLLLEVILMIALGWNYFKLLLEAVERYIVVGVLCYTSPLAYAMGGSKATNKVFASWCRMIGSQLLLLVMNIWFLRAFNSSVGEFIANVGALSSGGGNVFLWTFCALAFLKTAQKFDSYLASLGLSVAQTGSSMGMEMLMAARVLSGFGIGPRSVGSVFGGAAGTAGSAMGAASGGIMTSLASKFKGNSYVRDAVTEGGTRLGAGGSVGFVGRMFGGMAARGGATLSGESISSVAARAPSVSGSIAGEIADRSLTNYMPHLKSAASSAVIGAEISGLPGGVAGTSDGKTSITGIPEDKAAPAGISESRTSGSESIAGLSEGPAVIPIGGYSNVIGGYGGSSAESGITGFSNTEITGGHISTTAVTSDGKEAAVDLYSAAQYERPSGPYSLVSASDGSQWYQVASGDGMGSFYQTPEFTGDVSEAVQAASTFPGLSEGTSLRTLGDGMIEASYPDGGNSMWYNSAYYQEPDAPHDTIRTSDSVGWYAMQPHAATPYFEPDSGYTGIGDMPQGAGSGSGTNTINESAMNYNRVQFQNFMPGYEQSVSHVNPSRTADGLVEVRHADGTGTAFYDKTRYQSPRGDYQVYEDARGGQWYAVPGTPTVERRPVFEGGKPVYDGDKLRTVNVESIKYKSTLTQFDGPKRRDVYDRKPPNIKRK